MPTDKTEDKPEHGARAAARPQHPEAQDKLYVLVVDDDLVLARQLADGLTAVGQQCLTAHSSADARRILEQRADIGVVVSDIRMPGGDGLELALHITQALEEQRAVSAVLITGHATLEYAATAIRSGVADFLRKPFRLLDLTMAVERSMALARERRLRARKQAARDQRLFELEQQRQALLRQMDAASDRLAALPERHAPHGLERDIQAISHALRTPLNAIAGGAAMLQGNAGNTGIGSSEFEMLRSGVVKATEAVELVEELHRLEHTALPEAGPQPFALSAAVRMAADRVSLAAQAARIAIIPPDQDGPMLHAPRMAVDRIMELCLGAALDVGAALSTLRIACDRAEGWALATLASLPPGAAWPDLPTGAELPPTGTVYSRTQETLRFALARRIAMRLGGRLTSCNIADGAFAIRLALPR
jgi:FixJ family two-component response regulator